MKNGIEAMITDITATTAEAEDYTGEDGLLYCGKCHTPKEAYFAEGKTCFGRDRHPAECDCQRAAREKQHAAESRQKHLEKVEDLKRRGFTDPAMRNWTFEHDNGRNPQTETARFYVESWETMQAENIGYLFWGGVGTGKSYLAASFEGRNEYISRLCSYFNCYNYKGNRGTCTSTHYVRVDFLEEVVLGEIRRLTKFASLYEDEFVKAVIGHSQQAEQTDRKLKEKELKTLLARDEELDGLFERIYEDNVSGKLSDDRFAKMSRRYEDEQKELAEKIKKLRSEIEKQSSRSMTTDMFIGLVRKYTRARKLTPRMLNELIEKIEVFNAEKIDGVWEQRLRIHYNCVGTIEIPTVLPLPIPEVSVNTRKGVVVNYAPCELAV